jgi:predicted subunit of tRNA(5-methylaminomethyl-2-thiouridylate) methyltransferase
MTRQCAWCATYLDLVQSETCVTHGICESCVERIRRAALEELAAPLEGVLVGDGPGRPDLTPSLRAS